MIPGLKGSHLFVEVWVILNLVVSLLCMLMIQSVELSHIVSWFILIYSFTRVLEITVYQVNVMLFDPYQSSQYSVKSYRRLVILLLHNYVEVIFWFATSYMVLSKSFNVIVSQGTVIDSILFSFITMVTFGSNSLLSFQTGGQSIVFIQAIIGLFMTIISLARVIGLLPKPSTQDEKESERNSDIENLKIEIEHLRMKVDYLERRNRRRAK